MYVLNTAILCNIHYLHLMTNTITLHLTFHTHSTAEGYITFSIACTSNYQQIAAHATQSKFGLLVSEKPSFFPFLLVIVFNMPFAYYFRVLS